jgi:DNA (cytosine-5)-methyltransferase 1
MMTGAAGTAIELPHQRSSTRSIVPGAKASEQLEIRAVVDSLGPERVRIDDSGAILREVIRADQHTVSVSTLGVWPWKRIPSDPKAAADWLFLRLKTPPPSASSGTQVRVADLFSGCGAMSVGVAEACRALNLAFSPAGAFDINPVALEVYAKNFGTPTPAPVDLGAVFASQLNRRPKKAERALLKTLGRVDIVVAGPPCQGHSNLNNQTRRDDPKNELYFCLARFAKLNEPEHVIIENVPTVLSDKRRVVHRTEEALTKLGYTVISGLVNTWELGVPQTRKRHLLLASRKPVAGLKDIVARYSVTPRPAWWAISDLEDASATTEFDRSTEPKKVTRKRIDYLFNHDLHDLPDRMRPDCHRYKDHSYHAVYGRMYEDRLAPTITGGFDTMGRGRFVHPTRRRTITPHEAARIQCIPDFIDFSTVSKRIQLTELIGNAVPPKLSYVIALELLR